MILLEARGLEKSYDAGSTRVDAVRSVSLSLAEGEVALMMGPSGSGKTTLLSILGCILRPDRGGMKVCGEEVAWGESQLPRYRRRHFGFVYQHYNLLSALDVRENVMVPLTLGGVPRSVAEEIADHALGTVSLTHRSRFNPQKLSGGEKQRVAIARALASDAPILLADEPTGNLDSRNGTAVMSLLRDLATRRQKAVLVVSHDSRCETYADRIFEMEDGRVQER